MKVIQDLMISGKTFLNDGHFVLECTSMQGLPQILPGQFAEVMIPNNKVFLRRPLSIHDVDEKNQRIYFLTKIAGNGTRELSLAEKGSLINVVFPLGNGFKIPDSGHVLLVGGGCGSAPLLYLARKLNEKGVRITTLMGARAETDLFEKERFSALGDLFLSTDDGSCGEKGFITAHSLWNNIQTYDCIYCCGPEIMMKVVAKKAREAGIKCYVSLENTMACGVGACLCCVTETVHGNECVCTSGPVFNINELAWQI
jgi:dihydroorotate dehydrogenase electron transfer subunit